MQIYWWWARKFAAADEGGGMGGRDGVDEAWFGDEHAVQGIDAVAYAGAAKCCRSENTFLLQKSFDWKDVFESGGRPQWDVRVSLQLKSDADVLSATENVDACPLIAGYKIGDKDAFDGDFAPILLADVAGGDSFGDNLDSRLGAQVLQVVDSEEEQAGRGGSGSDWSSSATE